MEKSAKDMASDIKKYAVESADAVKLMESSIQDATASFLTLAGTEEQVVKTFSSIAGASTAFLQSTVNLIGNLQAGKDAMTLTANAASSVGSSAVSAVPGVLGFGTALNTALSVVSLVATAINLVTTLVNAFGESHTVAGKKVQESTDSLKASTDDLVSSTSASSVEYMKSMGALDGQAERAKNLAAEFASLRSSSDGTISSQEKMKAKGEELAGVLSNISGETYTYADVISMSTDMINRNIEAEKNLAAAQVLKERGIELANETVEASANLAAIQAQQVTNNNSIAEAEKERIALEEDLIKLELAGNDAAKAGTQSYAELNDALNDVNDQKRTAEKSNKDLAKAQEEAQEAVNAAMEAEERHAESVKISAGLMLNAYGERMEAGKELTDTELEHMQELMSMGGEFSGEMAARYGEMTDSQISKMEERRLKEEEGERARQVAQEDEIQRIKDGIDEIDIVEAENIEARRLKGEELNAVEQATLDRYNEMQQQALAEHKRVLEERVAAATNANDRINLADQKSIAEKTANMKHNTQIVDEMTSNLDSLYGKIPDSVYNHLKQAGVSEAGVIKEMADEMKEGGRAATDAYCDAYISGLEVGGAEISRTASGSASEVDKSTSEELSAEKSEAHAKEYMSGYKSGMEKEVAASNFGGIGKSIINDIKTGLESTPLPKIKIELDRNIAMPHFSVSGKLNAGTGNTPKVNVSWYDKGGLFNSAQVIGIAERRPEFVGAAQDLRSFINCAIADAFTVRQNPALLRSIGGISGNNALAGGDTNIYVNNSFSPREMTRSQMDYQAYKIRKELGRLVRA